jgi:hypothetical protein
VVKFSLASMFAESSSSIRIDQRNATGTVNDNNRQVRSLDQMTPSIFTLRANRDRVEESL